MATIKSYTDLEQSKRLAEVLPLESADMCYGINDDTLKYDNLPWLIPYYEYTAKEYYIPCWSLAALLDVLPDDCGVDKEDGKYVASYIIPGECNECGAYTKDNPIDACYEMIMYLHELNLV